jgi:hypothetical protein
VIGGAAAGAAFHGRRRGVGPAWPEELGSDRPRQRESESEAGDRRILYSARGRALAGSARERSDMGCGLLVLDRSVFLYCFVISSDFIFPWFAGLAGFFGFSCSKQFRIWINSWSEQFSKFTYFRIWIHFNFNKIRTWTNLNFEQISDLNKFEFWTNLGFEQNCIWTNLNFRIWTNFRFEQILDLNNFQIWTIFWIWTIFGFVFLDLNKFRKLKFSNLNNFLLWTVFLRSDLFSEIIQKNEKRDYTHISWAGPWRARLGGASLAPLMSGA